MFCASNILRAFVVCPPPLTPPHSFKAQIAEKLCFFTRSTWENQAIYLPSTPFVMCKYCQPLHFKVMVSHCFNRPLILHLCSSYQSSSSFSFLSLSLFPFRQDPHHLSSWPRWICAKEAAGVSPPLMWKSKLSLF